MNTYLKVLRNAAAATAFTAIAVTALTVAVNASAPSDTTKLLTAQFESRQVVQVEVGEFHFAPGQVAPIHTHDAPAVGYVVKGMIIYQVEGEKPQILREGDAFYEPTGKRILRFDNGSATEEAIFIDFNLEQQGEPFIVFENQPTEAIDRRTLPTIDLIDQTVDQVDIYASELAQGDTLELSGDEPAMGIVAEGIIEVQVDGKPAQRIVAGSSFELPTDVSLARIVNTSSDVPATVITFRLN